MSKKYEIDWRGARALEDPPNQKQIDETMRKLNNAAKTHAVISTHVSGPMYKWLKENVSNAFVKLVMSGNDVSMREYDHWILIGVDQYEVEKYYNCI